jgi:hypothetical protein
MKHSASDKCHAVLAGGWVFSGKPVTQHQMAAEAAIA